MRCDELKGGFERNIVIGCFSIVASRVRLVFSFMDLYFLALPKKYQKG
jgi:hypothetical protein